MTARLRCPKCKSILGALAGRVDQEPWRAPFVDPADGASLYRCKIHGRVAICPNGKMKLEARTR